MVPFGSQLLGVATGQGWGMGGNNLPYTSCLLRVTVLYGDYGLPTVKDGWSQ